MVLLCYYIRNYMQPIYPSQTTVVSRLNINQPSHIPKVTTAITSLPFPTSHPYYSSTASRTS